MPSGRSDLIFVTASRTSLTARSTGVTSWNWTMVEELPSVTVEVMSFTLPMEATAASTRCVIWVSISVGAAPGWEMVTFAAGKLTSGIWFTSMLMNPAMPRTVSMKNSTSGGTGLRMDQRSEEHTSELQSLRRISYAVFCLKKKIITVHIHN